MITFNKIRSTNKFSICPRHIRALVAIETHFTGNGRFLVGVAFDPASGTYTVRTSCTKEGIVDRVIKVSTYGNRIEVLEEKTIVSF